MIIIIISATDPLNACLNSFNISVSGLDSFNGLCRVYYERTAGSVWI